MDYSDILRRSFSIAWHNRWLWVLALFAGEAGGGASFNFGQGTSSNSGGRSGRTAAGAPDLQPFFQWASEHAGLIVAAAAAVVMLALLLYLLSCACQGAVVAGSAELDAGRACTLAGAWRLGAGRWLRLLGLRLLAALILMPVLLAGVLLAILGILAVVQGNIAAAVIGFLLALEFFVGAIACGVVMHVLALLAARQAIIEDSGAAASLRWAWALARRRPGRVALVWLIGWVASFAYGLIAAVLLVVGAVAVGGPLVAAGASGTFSPALLIPAGLGVLIVLALLLVAASIYGAFYSTYWTISWRRLVTTA